MSNMARKNHEKAQIMLDSATAGEKPDGPGNGQNKHQSMGQKHLVASQILYNNPGQQQRGIMLESKNIQMSYDNFTRN